MVFVAGSFLLAVSAVLFETSAVVSGWPAEFLENLYATAVVSDSRLVEKACVETCLCALAAIS